jgi:hypothetical protein
MTALFAIRNDNFSDILQSNGEELANYISIFEVLKKLSYRFILLQENDSLSRIFTTIYSNFKNNEDLKLIDKMLNKYSDYYDLQSYAELIEEIDNLIACESNDFVGILNSNNVFRHKFEKIGFNLNTKEGLRNISNIDDLKKALLLFCRGINDIDGFIKNIDIILLFLVFDDEINTSIQDLNDGFSLRKDEIIYHLFCIEDEIPGILSSNPHIGYNEIGRHLSIGCSPERDRETVSAKLKKDINGIVINCELHTKMRRLSSNPPDRIYFCPSLPNGVGNNMAGKIFIYKITKHA